MVKGDSTGDYPSWTSNELCTWIEKISGKFPEKDCKLYSRLARHIAMKDVWEWYEPVSNKLPNYVSTSTGLCIRIRRCMKMPGKPGNLPPKKRDEYFRRVRKHTRALIDLLTDTRYDNGSDQGKIVGDIREFQESLPRELENLPSTVRYAGEEWLLAYLVNDCDVYQLPWDYPDCHFVEFLWNIVAWTYEPDCWGRGFRSSAPIRQTSDSVNAIYLSCQLYEDFLRSTGVKIPFEILATITNVALDLPYEKLTNADTVRKQVTRYLNRVGLPKNHWPGQVPPDVPF